MDEADNGCASPYAHVRHAVEIKLHLAPEPGSVSEARHALDELSTLIPSRALEGLRLVISEFVTNSVRHAGLEPSDLITLKVSDSAGPVLVEVSNPGTGFEPPPTPESGVNGTGGHGLYLVDMLAERWGVEQEDGTSDIQGLRQCERP